LITIVKLYTLADQLLIERLKELAARRFIDNFRPMTFLTLIEAVEALEPIYKSTSSTNADTRIEGTFHAVEGVKNWVTIHGIRPAALIRLLVKYACCISSRNEARLSLLPTSTGNVCRSLDNQPSPMKGRSSTALKQELPSSKHNPL
jgi:hypothetical protein